MSFTIIGLVLNTAGAVLLVFFPPVLQRFTKDGAPEISWIGKPTPLGRFRGRWQRPLSIVGLLLLALGFVVQIYGEDSASQSEQRGQYLACTFTDDKHAIHERAFIVTLDSNGLKDFYGESWKVTIDTPISIVAEHESMLAGEDLGGEQFSLNRLSGSATISRLARPDKKPAASAPFPAGFREVESEESGHCEMTTHRAVGK